MANIPNSMYDYRYEAEQANKIGKCEVCENPIQEGETHYNFDGEKVCDECLLEYCSKNFKVI